MRRLASFRATHVATLCATRLTSTGMPKSGATTGSSDQEGKTNSATPAATAGSSASSSSPSAAHALGTDVPPVMDAKAAEQAKIAAEIGQEAFEENTQILKQVAVRGARAFVVCAVGLAAFSWAMKRKRKELAAEQAAAVGEKEDPTQRYLEEMRSIGFDVDTLEEELEQERKMRKAGIAVQKKRAVS